MTEEEIEKLARQIVIDNNPSGAENFSMTVFDGLLTDITLNLKQATKGYSKDDIIEAFELGQRNPHLTSLILNLDK